MARHTTICGKSIDAETTTQIPAIRAGGVHRRPATPTKYRGVVIAAALAAGALLGVMTQVVPAISAGLAQHLNSIEAVAAPEPTGAPAFPGLPVPGDPGQPSPAAGSEPLATTAQSTSAPAPDPAGHAATPGRSSGSATGGSGTASGSTGSGATGGTASGGSAGTGTGTGTSSGGTARSGGGTPSGGSGSSTGGGTSSGGSSSGGSSGGSGGRSTTTPPPPPPSGGSGGLGSGLPIVGPVVGGVTGPILGN